MQRWSYLIARVIILGLILLGVWVGTDPLTRTLIVSRLQQSTGSKVEIGQLRCSYRNNRMIIKDLAIAQPHDPMSNQVQADMVYLEFDRAALLHRQVVINQVQTGRLMFGTPRTTPGKLDGVEPIERMPYQSLRQTQVSTASIGQSWLDGLDPPKTSQSLPSSKFSDASRLLGERWAVKLNQIESEIKQVNQQTESARTNIESFDGNPLRWKPNQHVLKGIESDSTKLLRRLTDYQAQLHTDLAELSQAAAIDATAIQKLDRDIRFDADDMSNLLLTQLHAEYADQVVDLIRWLKHHVPKIESEYAPAPQRGVNIEFASLDRPPSVLIKAIQLDGEGRFFDNHFNFAGTAFNLSNEPQRLKEPTRIELRAQGNRHVLVSYVLDRRDGRSKDVLDLGCPEIQLAGRTLGDPNSLLVTMGPDTNIQANLHVEIEDGKLNGKLTFRHSNVALHVDQLNELAGGESAALKMNQGGLGLIREFQSEIQLAGTMEQPTLKATSDLGEKFSTAVNQVLNEKLETSIAQRRALLQKAKSVQLKSINDTIGKRLRELAEQVRNTNSRVSTLQKIQPNQSRITNQWR